MPSKYHDIYSEVVQPLRPCSKAIGLSTVQQWVLPTEKENTEDMLIYFCSLYLKTNVGKWYNKVARAR